MLSAKVWKLDAVIRLLLSVFICYFAGSTVVSVSYAVQAKTEPRFYLAAVGALGCMGAALFFVRQPWSLENVLKRMIRLMVFFYLGLVLTVVAQRWLGTSKAVTPNTWQLLLSVLCLQGASLAFIHLFLRDQGYRWKEAFGLDLAPGRAVLAGIGAILLFLPLGWKLQHVSVEMLTRWLHAPPEEQLPVQTLRQAVGWGDRCVLGFVTILLVPVAEELLFRGVLYSGLKQLGRPRLALWGSSLFFAAFHMSAPSFLPLFVLAMCLVALYEWSGNLLAPISAHALFNALNFILLYWLDKRP
jgi:membrane protease YdiL (CAAX protease family)